MGYLYLALAFIINATANILLKIGASRGVSLNWHAPLISFFGNWQLFLGASFFAVNILFYYLALRALPLSIAYPIMVAGSFVIVNGYALITLRESVGMIEIVGYALIFSGLFLVVSRG